MIKKILLYTLIGIFSLIILAMILLPFLIPVIVEKNSKKWIGRDVSIEKVRLNYFTGTARIYDLKLYEKDDSSVFVGFDTLVLDTEPYQLFSKNIVVEKFYLKGLKVNVIMYDSAFNFDDLMVSESDSVPAPDNESQDEGDPLQFELSNIELNDADFVILDAEISDTVEIRNFDFFLPYVAWNQHEQSRADLKFNFKNGGYFVSTIDANPSEGNFNLNFTLGNYQISGYQDFVAKYADAGQFKGVVDLDVNLAGNLKTPMETKVSSLFRLSDFALYDLKDSVMIGAEQFSVDLREFDLASQEILIDSISILRPLVYFELFDSTSNFNEYMNRLIPPEDTLAVAEEEKIPDENDSTKQLQWTLNAFLIHDGLVKLKDETREAPFSYQISNINSRTDSVTYNSTWLTTDITMLLNDRGKLESQVGLNPKKPGDLTLDFTVTDLMLSDFNIFSKEYVGYPLEYGDMFINSETEVFNDTLKSQNDIVIHNLKLGRKESVIQLPLKFAMFLLKDKDGVVHIDMPMEGVVGESGVGVGEMIWDTFTNLITKVVSAPFKILGAAYNVLDTDIKAIHYDFLDTTLTNKRIRQLDALLKIEDKSKEVEIDLVYFKDSVREREQIAIQLIGMDYSKGRRDYKKDQARFKKYLERRVKSDTLGIKDACLALADPVLVDSISTLYDSARFTGIRKYLESRNDSTEITLYVSKPDAPKNEDTKPVFEVKFGIKDELMKEEYVKND